MQYNIEPIPSASIADLARLVNCISESELAILAGVKPSTLESWRKRGKGPAYVLFGCNYLYPILAIQDYLANLTRTMTIVNPQSVML